MAADAVLGDPRRCHPVAGFGLVAAHLERRLYAPSRTRGLAHWCLLVGGCAAVGALLDRVARRPGMRAAVVAVTTWTVVGARSLDREAGAVEVLLHDGDVVAARERVRSLVGRHTDDLGADEIARAVVESVAENTSDAVVAPLLFGAALDVPGMLAYRAVNTLDAMVGHRSARYEQFGWAAAKLDDGFNIVPARVTASLAVLLAPTVGGSPRAALRAWRRDARRHPSPNAGPVEAAFAGALGRRLGGRNVYGEIAEDRGVLGDGPAVTAADIGRARRLALLVDCAACALAVALRAAR